MANDDGGGSVYPRKYRVCISLGKYRVCISPALYIDIHKSKCVLPPEISFFSSLLFRDQRLPFRTGRNESRETRGRDEITGFREKETCSRVAVVTHSGRLFNSHIDFFLS